MIFKQTITLALLLSLTACMPKLEDEDNDGPVTSTTELQKALGDAWGDVDPSTIRKNEFSYTELSQRVQGIPAYDPARIMFLEGLTVQDKQIKDADIEYSLVQQVSDLTGSESKVSSTEYHVSVPRPDAVIATEFNALKAYSGEVRTASLSFGVQIVYALSQACTKTSTWDEDCKTIKADKCELTCNNLKIENNLVAAPVLVRNRQNCEGLANCQMQTSKISFDQILKITRGEAVEKTKVGYSVIISPDVPYLSRLMSQCSRRLLTVSASNQKVLGEVCNDVKDFKLGDL